jgi:hypothetical protein
MVWHIAGDLVPEDLELLFHVVRIEGSIYTVIRAAADDGWRETFLFARLCDGRSFALINALDRGTYTCGSPGCSGGPASCQPCVHARGLIRLGLASDAEACFRCEGCAQHYDDRDPEHAAWIRANIAEEKEEAARRRRRLRLAAD